MSPHIKLRNNELELARLRHPVTELKVRISAERGKLAQLEAQLAEAEARLTAYEAKALEDEFREERLS